MKTQLAPLNSDSVESLISLLSDVASNMVAAGEMLARLHAADEDILQKIMDAEPGISGGFLRQLLRIGDGSLHPKILLNGCAAFQRLALLPYSTQEAAIKRKSVELVIDAESGDVLRVPLTDLTPAQVSQAIAPTGIRSRDDQRAYLKQRAATARIAESVKDVTGPAYQLRKGQLITLRPCIFTAHELTQILGQLTA